MSFLEIANLRKTYNANAVVENFNLSVARGEFISFLGPSGCGKTTTLRMVAGFETPTGGTIDIDGERVNNLPPNARKIGMVFQSYALFPNLSIADNVAFGLKVAGRPKAEINSRVQEMLEMIRLPHVAARYPYQLSGGQQQRVALARAIAVKPRVLLLDEPLSALDAKIRISLRDEIRALQRNLGITTIYVTHDQEEALSMSDRIVVMSEGRIEQIGTPFEIYNRPASRFVASFVGTLSLIEGEAVAADTLRIGTETIAVDELASASGTPVMLALRPESVSLHPSEKRRNRLTGSVEHVAFLGSVVRLKAATAGGPVLVDVFNDPTNPPPKHGARVELYFSPQDCQIVGKN
ncbi:ABC transporter ATP-binding protein [Aureimonas fodinaquatilis]|uniref:Spermidine/putrescine import ATP-binding protein PotA n=1 Tax=Aureimonas fodinaquatilis TaxID=2565783 RepID=A0A5B0E3A1_9HYPH|nr:ABC transporter ATP-binding protein [Aureimonas fodinaquatilis]KAA0972230.1 ABC transporter ATP-binding protein [Aureimonas fodinaquatilis]